MSSAATNNPMITPRQLSAISAAIERENLAPQCGHVRALLETEPPHSLHFVMATPDFPRTR
jgi:hypothetical protein